MSKIAVVIPTVVTAHSSKYLPKLLHSLNRSWRESRKSQLSKKATKITGSIFVFANGLTPHGNEERKLQRYWQKQLGTQLKLTVLSTEGNRGFTGAINDSMVYVTQFFAPNWTVVLNDDTVVEENFFSVLLKSARSHHLVVNFPVRKPNGEVESYGLRYWLTGLAFPYRSVRDLTPTDRRYSDWLLCGTGFLVNQKVVKQMFNQFGYFFNPLFFAYAEDVEFSVRCRQLNIPLSFTADTSITHFGSQTARRGSEFQLYHGFRNLLLVGFLTWSPSTFVICMPALFVGLMYCLLLSWYKGYWKLWLRIGKYIWRNAAGLLKLRQQYDTQRVSSYSF